jgi:hypothetical protein
LPAKVVQDETDSGPRGSESEEFLDRRGRASPARGEEETCNEQGSEPTHSEVPVWKVVFSFESLNPLIRVLESGVSEE